MSELTVETTCHPAGLAFRRSDGEIFFLLGQPNGDFVLYRGEFTTEPTRFGLVHLDVSLQHKVERALEFVVAYPDAPA
jgi:hypothetical protein